MGLVCLKTLFVSIQPHIHWRTFLPLIVWVYVYCFSCNYLWKSNPLSLKCWHENRVWHVIVSKGHSRSFILQSMQTLHCQVSLASGCSLGHHWSSLCFLPGQTSFKTTLSLSLPTSGDRPFHGAMVERLDNLSRLHDEDEYAICAILSIVCTSWWTPSGGWAGSQSFMLSVQTKKPKKNYIDNFFSSFDNFQALQ